MDRHCTIRLIRELPGTHGVHDEPEIEERMRYAVRSSASRSEFYQAGTIGLQPSGVFKMAAAEEYEGEMRLIYEGRVYDIIRTYETKDGGIELTVQRRDAP